MASQTKGRIKKRRLTVYLAHPIWTKGKGRELQIFLEEKGIGVINPFEHEVPSNKILKKDLALIAGTDALVAFLPSPNVGVSMEMMFAWLIHIPIYLIDSMEHPFFPEMDIIRCKNEEELARKLKKG